MNGKITAKTRVQTYKDAIEHAVDSLPWSDRQRENALRAFGYFVLSRVRDEEWVLSVLVGLVHIVEHILNTNHQQYYAMRVNVGVMKNEWKRKTKMVWDRIKKITSIRRYCRKFRRITFAFPQEIRGRGVFTSLRSKTYPFTPLLCIGVFLIVTCYKNFL